MAADPMTEKDGQELDTGPSTGATSLHKAEEHTRSNTPSSHATDPSVPAVPGHEQDASVGKKLDDESKAQQHLSKWSIFTITFALCLANLCTGLDITIISTAIPKITDQFHALQDVGWYGSAYMMTQCSCLLVYGKIYAVFNLKWAFLSAMLIFEIGSAVCGAAPNSTAFIVGRAIAGLGSAGIFTGGVLILSESVPLSSLPLYISIISMMVGASSVAGPLMGGVFTENSKLTWRWCFYINLPLGLVTILAIIFLFHPKAKQSKEESSLIRRIGELDLIGVTLLLPSIILLVLALSIGGTQHPWKSVQVVVPLVMSIVLVMLFALQQWRRGEAALVPLSILNNRNVLGSFFYALANGGTYNVLVYYVPLWFQVVKEVSAMKSGIMSIPLITGTILFLFVAGAFTTRTGWYTHFFYFSSLFMSVGVGLCTTWQPSSGASRWITDLLISGIGLGLGMQQPITAMQNSLEPAQVPTGTSIVMFANGMGSAIMLSVGQNVFTNQVMKNVGAVTKAFDPRIILTTGATQLRKITPLEVYPAVIRAYSKSITNTFYSALALAILSFFSAMLVQWKRVKKEEEKSTAATATV